MSILERLQILVTREQRRWLEAESVRRSEPVTAIVRSAIDGARSHRTRSQRLAALAELEAGWASSSERVTELSIDAINAMTDDGRLEEVMMGLKR